MGMCGNPTGMEGSAQGFHRNGNKCHGTSVGWKKSSGLHGKAALFDFYGGSQATKRIHW